MKKQVNLDPERCNYCYRNLDRNDLYENNCKCGMKKCLYDCKSETEISEWIEKEGA